ncbi:YggS family pyridoxal phosphate-dependent enzyme [Chloroflexales bacterium ZM16-3]|nr:YggS family pyridoxal phosphate-dependent enzyme [Chloroflexales bacterium ZM16-3]
MQQIATRIAAIREQIAASARSAGRRPEEITLVAVSKTHSPDIVRAAVAAGADQLGENRVQEATPKIAALAGVSPRPRWHLIGHLQRNKARAAAELFDMIQSVDSLRLAETLDRHAAELGRRLPVLLQVNVSGEASKEGFALAGGITNQPAYAALLAELEQVTAMTSIEVRGLMTIAPLAESPAQARPTFRLLRELRDDLARRIPQARWDDLSMGMSDDFEAAIAEGATIVRVGRAIFGDRPSL